MEVVLQPAPIETIVTSRLAAVGGGWRRQAADSGEAVWWAVGSRPGPFLRLDLEF
jgi:hypothetical protein